MKSYKSLILLSSTLIMACATAPKVAQETYQSPTVSRAIAEVDVTEEELSGREVKRNIKGIFHSYLLGQVRLNEFDAKLDTDAKAAMHSDEYNELQAIRVSADEYEHQINDLYLKLVMVRALPKYSHHQKTNAKKGLRLIERFLNGNISEEKKLPENLKYLVLANLKEKQISLYQELKAISLDSSVTNNDPEVIDVIHEHMKILNDQKKSKDDEAYKVDQILLNQTVDDELKDEDFKKFKSGIKKLSKKMKAFFQQITKGRSTSSDVLYPSTSSAGNITGNGFPANTWSITYDDGPGGKTSPTVLKNLQDRGLKATFFMLAKQVEGLPTTAKNIANAGMDIASHSYDHAQLTKVGPIGLQKQIPGSKKIIEEKLGKEVKLFRLPYGAGVSSASIQAKIAESKMIHVFWNVDTLDWQDKNPTSIFNRAVKQMNASPKNSGVVLFHDIHAQSVIASTMLMDYMKEKKIKVCTVQAVVNQLNKGLATCQP